MVFSKKGTGFFQSDGDTVVIFDMDGTLGLSLIPEEEAFRKVFELTCQEASRSCGSRVSLEKMEQFYRQAKKEHYELYPLKPRRHNKRIRLRLFLEKVQQNNGIRFASEFLDKIHDFYWKHFVARAKPYPDTHKTLEMLNRKSIVVIATNNEDEETELKMKLFGLKPGKHYRFLFSSERLGICKPAPEFLERLIQCLEEDLGQPITGKRIFVVGDDPRNDFAWAKSIGAITIRVRKDLHAEREPTCEDEKPDYTVNNISEILDII